MCEEHNTSISEENGNNCALSCLKFDFTREPHPVRDSQALT